MLYFSFSVFRSFLLVWFSFCFYFCVFLLLFFCYCYVLFLFIFFFLIFCFSCFVILFLFFFSLVCLFFLVFSFLFCLVFFFSFALFCLMLLIQLHFIFYPKIISTNAFGFLNLVGVVTKVSERLEILQRLYRKSVCLHIFFLTL